MAEKKRKKTRTSEFWETYGPRFEETDRRLLERIEYHKRKSAEERAAREAAAKDEAA